MIFVLCYEECFFFLLFNARISIFFLPPPPPPPPLSGLLSFILQPLIKLSVCFYPKALLSLPHLNLLWKAQKGGCCTRLLLLIRKQLSQWGGKTVQTMVHSITELLNYSKILPMSCNFTIKYQSYITNRYSVFEADANVSNWEWITPISPNIWAI